MAIFVTRETRVIIQGITGREGAHHTARMIDYGTNIVGGVTPGKGGDWINGKPIFDTAENAVNATGAEASVIFVPPLQAADAIYEAIDAGIQLIVCITDGIPVLDAIRFREYIRYTPSRLIGPNSPGILIPGKTSLGIIPPEIAISGDVAIVSRSATLAYSVADILTQNGIGQSVILGIGGDPVVGTSFMDALRYLEDDPFTRSIVLIGEIGGQSEIEAAQYIGTRMSKPVVAHITGRSAPYNVQMGHRGAIIDEENTDAETKIDALKHAGARVVDNFEEIPLTLLKLD